MKKTIVPALLFLLCAALLTAQESGKWTVILGPEWNMNSRENFAAGAVLGLDYTINELFAAGLKGAMSYNFDGIAVAEPAGFFRWYFLDTGQGRFFVQGDLGASLIFEDSTTNPLFAGGLAAGYRLPLNRIYLEPSGRFGYPFAFGLGLMAGIGF
jgi:hypothetical protein